MKSSTFTFKERLFTRFSSPFDFTVISKLISSPICASVGGVTVTVKSFSPPLGMERVSGTPSTFHPSFISERVSVYESSIAPLFFMLTSKLTGLPGFVPFSTASLDKEKA